MINKEFGVSKSRTELVNICGFLFMLTKNSFGKIRSIKRKREKIGRNTLCPCGSKKKYKKCCISKKRIKILKERRQK